MEHITTYGQASEFQKVNRVLVCTLAAYGGREEPRGFGWLKQSCDKFGVELTIFGEGHRFIDMYSSKLEYVGHCIWQLRDQYDYVLCIDSADTLFLRPLDNSILPTAFGPKMVFCAERNCFPLEQLRPVLEGKAAGLPATTYKFLNAGGFYGDMREVTKVFAYMAYKKHMLGGVPEMEYKGMTSLSDDQAAWSLEYAKGLVGIDHYCRVFQSLWGHDYSVCFDFVEPFSGEKGVKLISVEHWTQPLLLHGNGGAKYEDIYNKIVRGI